MCGAVTPGVVTLDFAHFANGSSITAGLVLVNVASHPIRPELYFYDRGGKGIAAESVVEITEELEVAEDGSLTVQGRWDRCRKCRYPPMAKGSWWRDR